MCCEMKQLALCVRVFRLMVAVYNPAISIASLIALPLEDIYHNPSDMLAAMAHKVGGQVFHDDVCRCRADSLRRCDHFHHRCLGAHQTLSQ